MGRKLVDGRKPGSGGARKGAGRDPFVPTSEQRHVVEMAASCGLTTHQIMQFVINPRTKQPIGLGTLHRKFQGELERGWPKAVLAVYSSLFVNATKHMNVTAQIYFLKTVGKGIFPSEASINVNATVAHSGSSLGDAGEALAAAINRLRVNGSADESGASEADGGTVH